MESRSRIKLYKGFWGSLVVVAVIWLMLAGVVESGRTNMKNNKVMQNKVHSHMDLNFKSIKRRVPNGPDPIHNRRAGNSRQPHGQVSKEELGKP
ncbi:hypothetical protein A4A49_26661 [Nicotiana attenuata]|uniref:CLAVATA3/ESR (CLE)-related protein 25 n=1 Tax=Nicotiana attenuata TaxID=49451 RepID=A0A1J6KX22_NICAT|nr:hypothetical protein A4A49_26661 [Nicotiana attenuata]